MRGTPPRYSPRQEHPLFGNMRVVDVSAGPQPRPQQAAGFKAAMADARSTAAVDLGVAHVARRRLRQPTVTHAPPAWVGSLLGHGAFGYAYAVPAQALPRLRELAAGLAHVVRGAELPSSSSTSLALKVSVDTGEDDRWLERNVHEAAVHAWLGRQPCVSIRGCVNQLCAAQYVPALYFAGAARGADGHRYFVVAMDRAGGAPLRELLRHRAAMPLLTYLALEKAVAALWAAGVVHADLHPGNVLVSGARGERVTLIDLGLAVMVPDDYRGRIVRALEQGMSGSVRSLGEVFGGGPLEVQGLQRYVNRVMESRGVLAYFSDYSEMLQRYYNRLSSDDRRRLPSFRKRYWGCR